MNQQKNLAQSPYESVTLEGPHLIRVSNKYDFGTLDIAGKHVAAVHFEASFSFPTYAAGIDDSLGLEIILDDTKLDGRRRHVSGLRGYTYASQPDGPVNGIITSAMHDSYRQYVQIVGLLFVEFSRAHTTDEAVNTALEADLIFVRPAITINKVVGLGRRDECEIKGLEMNPAGYSLFDKTRRLYFWPHCVVIQADQHFQDFLMDYERAWSARYVGGYEDVTQQRVPFVNPTLT